MLHLLFIFILSFSVLFADETLIISKKSDIFTDFQVQMYEESNSSVAFKDIVKVQDFQPHANHLSKGYSNDTTWFKFKIKNNTQTPLEYFVKFKDTISDKTDCYIISQDHSYQKFEHGIGHLKKGEIYQNNTPLFKFNLLAGETKTIYLSVFSKYAMFVSFDILNNESLKDYDLLHDSLFSLYFGAILALLLYNFFIYLLNREKVYFYYILYVLSFLTWQLTSNGFYPFNTFNSNFTFYALGSIVPMWIAMLIFFSRSILETKKLLPKSDKFLLFIGIFYILLTFTSMFFSQKSFIVINLLATFILPFLLYIGYRSYKLGNKPAIFFVIAQTTFLSMSTLFSLMSDGVFEYSTLTRYGIVVASFIEMILFAFALGYKIKQLQDEKLEIIYQHNIELDKKVKQRTKELENTQEKLRELANKDPLTNLYNRRFLLEFATKLIELAKRQKNDLTIIMFDIDKFKNVNDTYGHAVGDIVIKEFATILKETRESDIVARIGGEEFIVLLPNTDLNTALEIANSIRIKSANMKIKIEDKKFISFTVSGGVDSLLIESDDTIDEIIQRADTALYKAKENGRNQICVN